MKKQQTTHGTYLHELTLQELQKPSKHGGICGSKAVIVDADISWIMQYGTKSQKKRFSDESMRSLGQA